MHWLAGVRYNSSRGRGGNQCAARWPWVLPLANPAAAGLELYNITVILEFWEGQRPAVCAVRESMCFICRGSSSLARLQRHMSPFEKLPILGFRNRRLRSFHPYNKKHRLDVETFPLKSIYRWQQRFSCSSNKSFFVWLDYLCLQCPKCAMNIKAIFKETRRSSRLKLDVM